MIFAICLVPLMVGVGAAVDYSRLVDARETMQHSLDATVLALSSEASKLTIEQITSRAKQIFDVNFPAGTASGIAVSATYTRNNGATLVASAKGTVPMTFLNIIGIASKDVAVTSKAAWSSRRLRVALALDNTGSMAGSKLSALKEATTNLLEKLQGESTTDGDIYVSIIPFNKDVNLGTAFYKSSMISWTKTGQYCTKKTDGSGGYNCTANTTLWKGGSNYASWGGCVADRDKDNNVNNDISVTAAIDESTRYPAESSDVCLSQITPMTNNWTVLDNAVKALSANGPTNQTIGLVWAWQSLKSAEPLSAPPKVANFDYQDVIILLSDGDNTMNRFGGTGTAISTQVDERMSKVCAAAKADNVVIYTVLVISGNANVLRNCASSPDNYFNASTASDIITSFGAIGDKLSALRIAQ